MKKWISLLLTVVMLLCAFTGCGNNNNNTEDTAWQTHIQYTQDQAMVDGFYAILDEAEQIATAGQDLEGAEEAFDRLDEAYMELIDQEYIAYILYCVDQSDEDGKKRYLDSVDIVVQAEADYNAMARRLHESGSPAWDTLFGDWTEDEINRVLKHTEEVAQLEARNAQLTLQFRELDSASWVTDMIPIYNEMVTNNNRIAEIYGFENYYEYAFKMVYFRDYGAQELQKLRTYTAQYMPQICINVTSAYNAAYGAFSNAEKNTVNSLMKTNYEKLSRDYVQMYIESIPQSSQEVMNDMFQRDRCVFAGGEESYSGAFTTWIDGEAFCYFGPGYRNSETVIHELGHYYGAGFVSPWSMPVDLCETQSQGNEWLFVNFMKDQLNSKMFEAFENYKMASDTAYIIGYVMVDEFEERVYSHENAGNLTVEEYNAIMAEVAEPYGGIDYISNNIIDIQTYWKQVVVESPLYYVSYAVSAMASIDLYAVSQQDPEQAWSIYTRLIQEADEEKGFLGNIQQAGLTGPFEESVYQYLAEKYAN